MLFLVEYNRSLGSIAQITAYDDSERELAENARLTLELKLHRQGIEKEVVLLEAASEAALRLTHRRYFEDLAELAKSSASST
ncbi:MAG TPA: hypothetical protein VGA18_07270 [Rhodothermales bacterium]